MSKPTNYHEAMRESMDRVDELMGFRNRKEFGQKTEPSGSEIEINKNRRLQDVRDRAHGEKFGFLQSLKSKVFGNKAPAAEFKRDERSEEERRTAVLDRARRG